MHRSITIKDIARAAEVAPSTVSRALHADPRISEERRAVLVLASRWAIPQPSSPKPGDSPNNTIGCDQLHLGLFVASLSLESNSGQELRLLRLSHQLLS